jgi:hypothetical protein
MLMQSWQDQVLNWQNAPTRNRFCYDKMTYNKSLLPLRHAGFVIALSGKPTIFHPGRDAKLFDPFLKPKLARLSD